MDKWRYIGFLPDICARDLGRVVGEMSLWAGTSLFFLMTSFGLVEISRIVGTSNMVTAGS